MHCSLPFAARFWFSYFTRTLKDNNSCAPFATQRKTPSVAVFREGLEKLMIFSVIIQGETHHYSVLRFHSEKRLNLWDKPERNWGIVNSKLRGQSLMQWEGVRSLWVAISEGQQMHEGSYVHPAHQFDDLLLWDFWWQIRPDRIYPHLHQWRKLFGHLLLTPKCINGFLCHCMHGSWGTVRNKL